MIDLHTHTTRSDGRLDPAALVREAWMAGIRTLSITDHDTTAAVADATVVAEGYGLTLIPGIEITAVAGADVHVLGYFTEISSDRLQGFLARQREARVARVREIGRLLASLGRPIDLDLVLARASKEERSVGRPAVAAELVAAGHASTAREAFERWLGHGRPAAVARSGPTVEEVLTVIHDAGGLASLAHPGLYDDDTRIPEWAAAGLDAIEVYHCEHDPDDVARYRDVAERFHLLITGGSDYHGDVRDARARLGHTTLPETDFLRFRASLA